MTVCCFCCCFNPWFTWCCKPWKPFTKYLISCLDMTNEQLPRTGFLNYSNILIEFDYPEPHRVSWVLEYWDMLEVSHVWMKLTENMFVWRGERERESVRRTGGEVSYIRVGRHDPPKKKTKALQKMGWDGHSYNLTSSTRNMERENRDKIFKRNKSFLRN